MYKRAVFALAAVISATTGAMGTVPPAVGAHLPNIHCDDRLVWESGDNIASSFTGVVLNHAIDFGLESIDPLDMNVEVQWSHDGEQLLWQADLNGETHLVVSNRYGLARKLVSTTGGSTPVAERNSRAQWSPDDSHIVWNGLLNGEWHIYVARADGTGRKIVSTAGGQPYPTGNFSPQWSPDGGRLAWRGDDEILVSNVDGTNRVSISGPGTGGDPSSNERPRWSPDGSLIMWSGWDGTNYQIWTATPTGNDRQIVSDEGASPPTDNTEPTWAPGGGSIAWSGNDGTAQQIYIAAEDGTGREVVSDGGINAPTANFRPAFAHDGTRIAWYGKDVQLVDQVWVASLDGANREAISKVAPTLLRSTVPQWSPDDRWISWHADDGDTYKILVARPDGSRRYLASEQQVRASELHPTWSPDGSAIAWSAKLDTPSPGEQHIFMANDDGSEVQILTHDLDADLTLNTEPAFSPDGSTLAWAGGSSYANRRIRTMHLQTRAVTSLSSTSDGLSANSEPVWSPSGDRIVWWGEDANDYQIFVADADGANRLAVTTVDPATRSADNWRGAWSPNGDWLAWTGLDKNDVSQIWVARADGTQRRAISNVEAPALDDNNEPKWSPDGDEILWWASDGADYEIFVADIHGRNRRSISNVGEGPDPADNWQARWSPAGDRISWNGRYNSNRQIFMANADGTGRTHVSHSELADAKNQRPRWHGFGPHGFADVAESSFAWDHIRCIKGLGITTGTSSTTYSPSDFVTREQMGAFLARTWQKTKTDCSAGDHPFVDVPETSFADESIFCIWKLGITKGTSPTTYSPDAFVTREQMAAFLGRLWRRFGNWCSDDPHGFTDVPETSFASADIACIKALGITTGTSPTTYSPDAFVTREQMAAFLGRFIQRGNHYPS